MNNIICFVEIKMKQHQLYITFLSILAGAVSVEAI